MSVCVETAMVLAAGLGTRMRPLTDDRPKALVELGGRALIDHMLDRLAADGVTRAVVNVHHFADVMERHLAKRTAPEIIVSDERAQLLETGGGLVKARRVLGDEPVFVCNIDSAWIEDDGAAPALAALRERWDGERMDALLLLADTQRSLGYAVAGDFHTEPGGRVRRRGADASAPWAYTGVQLFHPRALEGFAEEPFSLNRVWDRMLDAGRLHGAPLKGFWMHVGDPSARDEAQARLSAPAT